MPVVFHFFITDCFGEFELFCSFHRMSESQRYTFLKSSPPLEFISFLAFFSLFCLRSSFALLNQVAGGKNKSSRQMCSLLSMFPCDTHVGPAKESQKDKIEREDWRPSWVFISFIIGNSKRKKEIQLST